MGLYYSQDAGVTWQMATIEDGTGQYVQRAATAIYPGNAATAVVWNPVRQMFYAAVRYHGYYSVARRHPLDAPDKPAGHNFDDDGVPHQSEWSRQRDVPHLSRRACGAAGDRRHIRPDRGRQQSRPGFGSGCLRAHRIGLRNPPDRIQQEADLDSAGGRQRIDRNPAGGLQPLAGSRGDRNRFVRRHAALCRHGEPLSLLAGRRMRAAQHNQRNQWMQCPGDGLPGATRDCNAGGSGNGWHAAAALCEQRRRPLALARWREPAADSLLDGRRNPLPEPELRPRLAGRSRQLRPGPDRPGNSSGRPRSKRNSRHERRNHRNSLAADRHRRRRNGCHRPIQSAELDRLHRGGRQHPHLRRWKYMRGVELYRPAHHRRHAGLERRVADRLAVPARSRAAQRCTNRHMPRLARAGR